MRKKENRFAPTGSTLLNLAVSSKAFGGLRAGCYYYLVGDSMAGKTWISMNTFAEANINPKFDEYRFIYDGPEGGALMNIAKYFGKETKARIESPSEAGDSYYIEDFYSNIKRLFSEGYPFIYVLDSMDTLESLQEEQKEDRDEKNRKSGKDTPGAYGGLNKAKINSRKLGRVVNKQLPANGSILIILGQTRDNLSGYGGKTRAGGRALRFYATAEIWLSRGNRIKKIINRKERKIGSYCKATVKKSRETGKERVADFSILDDFGIDDIGDCIDFLVSEKRFNKKPKGRIIIAPEFEFQGKRESLIWHIEKNELENELRELTQEVWREIEIMTKPKRKKRYS